jgi:hypothetical protein
MRITADTILAKNRELLDSKIDDEYVMMSIENGEYYGLNKIASRIWELLDNPQPFKKLINKLLSEYDVGREECEEDVKKYLLVLADKQLIILDNLA